MAYEPSQSICDVLCLWVWAMSQLLSMPRGPALQHPKLLEEKTITLRKHPSPMVFFLSRQVGFSAAAQPGTGRRRRRHR